MRLFLAPSDECNRDLPIKLLPEPALRDLGPPRVRCLALEATCAHFAAAAEPHLRRALLDEARSVREVARFLWTKTGRAPVDFAAFYREALVSVEGRRFAAALEGLAETGGEEEASLFEPHVHDPRAAVRAAAVLGLGRCGLARYGDALLVAMKDPSARVTAAARFWVRLRLGRAYAAHCDT
jgi:HEAT repeat protein